MTIVMCVPVFAPGRYAGGPIKSLLSLAEEESRSQEVHVITPVLEFGTGKPYPTMARGGITRRNLGEATVAYVGGPVRPNLVRELRSSVDKESSLYVSSLFSFTFSVIPIILSVLRIVRPRVVVVAPRGELGKAALAIKQWKKRPALWVLRRILGGRDWVVWHSTSGDESLAIKRHFGANARVREISNSWPAPRLPALTRPGGSVATVLFVARIVPIKGLHIALDALSRVKQPVRFVIAGRAEDMEYWEDCLRQIAQLPDHVNVTHLGHVEGDELAEAYNRAQIFLMPTQGENFGHAIADALAFGLYVLVPDTTPWTPVIEQGAGEIITNETSDIARRLDVLLDENGLRSRSAKVHETYVGAYQNRPSHASLFGTQVLGPRAPCDEPL